MAGEECRGYGAAGEESGRHARAGEEFGGHTAAVAYTFIPLKMKSGLDSLSPWAPSQRVLGHLRQFCGMQRDHVHHLLTKPILTTSLTTGATVTGGGTRVAGLTNIDNDPVSS